MWKGRLFENVFVDFLYTLRNRGAQLRETEVTLLAIDDASLTRYQAPGTLRIHRRHFARLVRRLSRHDPAAIVFDVVFDRSEIDGPAADLALVEAVRDSGRVVLACQFLPDEDDPEGRLILPLPRLHEHAGVGFADIGFDPDRILRKVTLLARHGGTLHRHLGLAAACRFLGAEELRTEARSLELCKGSTTLRRIPLDSATGSSWLHFSTPDRTWSKITLEDLLEENLPDAVCRELIQGKIVLVGADSEALRDRHWVSSNRFGPEADKIAGYKVVADVIENVLGERFLRAPSPVQAGLLLILIGGGSGYLYGGLSALPATASHLLFLLALLLLSVLAFGQGLILNVADGALVASLLWLLCLLYQAGRRVIVRLPSAVPEVQAPRFRWTADVLRDPRIADFFFQFHMPYPLASNLRLLLAEGDRQQQGRLILRCWSLLVRHLAFLLASDAKLPPAKLRPPKDGRIAHWIDVVEQALKQLRDEGRPCFLPELPEALETADPTRCLLREVWEGAMAELEGEAVDPSKVESLLSTTGPALRECLRRLHFLHAYPLAYVEDPELRDGRHYVFLRRCSGASPVFETRYLAMEEALPETTVLLLDRNHEACLDLSLGYRIVEIAELEEDGAALCPLDSMDGSTALWIDPATEARVEGPWPAQLPEKTHLPFALAEDLRNELLAPRDDLSRTGLLDGKYQIVGLLKRGGMGDVYKAIHVELDRMVAIKVLPEELGRDERLIRRFHQEARLMAGLDSEHIVHVHDNGVSGSRNYMVMEFIDGEDLKEFLDREGPQSDEATLAMAHEVGLGLAHIHARKIVHRDIKPSNIMFNGDGAVKITDFGIAKSEMATSKFTATGERIGTNAYMSPEQRLGEAVGPASDIYSLGCVLYEMRTGSRPGPGEGALDGPAVMAMAPPLRELLQACLEEDLSRRLPDAQAMLTMLQEDWSETQARRTLPAGMAPTARAPAEDEERRGAQAFLEGHLPTNYEGLRLLGQGGMGVVFASRDETMGRNVAIKVLSPLLAEQDEMRLRFIREAEAAQSLDHPHVIRIHRVFRETTPFFVMDFLEGQAMDEILEREGSLEAERAVALVMQVADALGFAHSKGIVHRDVKPGNVHVGAKDHVTLLDFGLAKMEGLTQLTRTGAMIGTPYYMAPEQFEAEIVDARCDVYALGVVLYESLTGKRPFVIAPSRSGQAGPRKPSQVSSKVPLWLDGPVMRCLAMDPLRRYPSMKALREDLSGLKTAHGI